MLFRLRLAGWRYAASVRPRLEALGFRFLPYHGEVPGTDGCWHRDAAQDPPLWMCDNLEALLAFQEAQGCPVILSRDDQGRLMLELYDDYRE
jgi:hypothetical protein